MAESAQILSMSAKHESIADWLLSNVDLPLSACARAHGVTQPWLSTVIHSSVFVEYFARRRRNWENGLRDRIQGAQLEVHLKAMQKLMFFLEDEKAGADPFFALSVAEKTAKMLGYEPRPTMKRTVEEETERTVMRPVAPEQLALARERMTRRVIEES
jgi:hypothetical protein